jgi:hypothetical protein
MYKLFLETDSHSVKRNYEENRDQVSDSEVAKTDFLCNRENKQQFQIKLYISNVLTTINF